MNKDTLSLLGCTSSLALILLTTNPANAAEITPQPANSVDSTVTIAQVNTPLAQQDSEYTSAESSKQDDVVKAIMGCGCATCQSRVNQMRLNSPSL